MTPSSSERSPADIRVADIGCGTGFRGKDRHGRPNEPPSVSAIVLKLE
jgi:hypothetical protein